MSGVPRDIGTANDFMMVRAALVRYLGNAAQALVFVRVQYRCETTGMDRIEDPSGRWWRASHPVLAEETGLTQSGVRTALSKLTDAGAVESRKHHRDGSYDHTISYRPLWQNDMPDSAERYADPDTSIDLSDSADVSSIEEVKTKNSFVSQADTREDVEGLCTLLADRIAANGNRATVSAGWRTSARLLVDRDEVPLTEAIRVVEWCQTDNFWNTVILSMPKFREKYPQLLAKARAAHRLAATPQLSAHDERVEGWNAFRTDETPSGDTQVIDAAWSPTEIGA